MRQAHHWMLLRRPSAQVASSVDQPTVEEAGLSWTRSAVAVTAWIGIATAAGAGVMPLVRTAEACSRSRDTTSVAESARNCTDVMRAGHPAGVDDALPARYRKLVRKRPRGRVGLLPSRVISNGTLLLADIRTRSQGAPPDRSAPDRTPARAPPASHQPA